MGIDSKTDMWLARRKEWHGIGWDGMGWDGILGGSCRSLIPDVF